MLRLVKVLGINSYFFSSSACLVDDGRVLSAVQDERLVRRKFSSEFPQKSIDFCLSKNGIEYDDLEAITFPADLAVYLENFSRPNLSSLRHRGELGYAIANYLVAAQGSGVEATDFVQEWKVNGKSQNLHFINHHLSHAAQSFFLSPFEESAILVMDGFGEKACQLSATGKGTKLTPLDWVEFPHSLGMFYAAFTEFLGFRPNSDEWKLMGASSYGNPDRFAPKLFELIRVHEGRVELDLSYFNFFQFHRPGYCSPKLRQFLPVSRAKEEALAQEHFDLAAAVQKVTEEIVFQILGWLKKKTGSQNICLGGGVFQNSVLNGKIRERTGFEGLYIPSAPDDSGASVGCALYYTHHLKGAQRESKPQFNYWGPSYTDDEIRASLKIWKIPYVQLKSPEKAGARIIKDGHILGWFQGAVEFGDRALGNRSIVADPRNPGMKDLINSNIKFRERFRPFAPSILTEHVDEYFVKAEPTPFMEKVYSIKPEKRTQIPAVTHTDGSGRLQTVTQEQNARYHSLISEFHALTGVPIVLNTSFNLNNEPIVSSPEDAVRTFMSCGMDFLILGSQLLGKDPVKMSSYQA